MNAATQSINKNKVTAKAAEQLPLDNSIFRDRRQKTMLHSPCRRRNNFSTGNTDVSPWWLKVNYVSQHLALGERKAAS